MTGFCWCAVHIDRLLGQVVEDDRCRGSCVIPDVESLMRQGLVASPKTLVIAPEEPNEDLKPKGLQVSWT